jgi:putative peptide zinc metalloprotease protein
MQQFMPFLRMDGYYVISDLTGVPDMFNRIKPILVSLIPWKRSDPKVRELKWWARAVVTVWVLLLVPIIGFNLALMLVGAPRIFATAWSSFRSQLHSTTAAFGAGQSASGALGIVQMLALALPIAGITYIFVRFGSRLARKGLQWSENSPSRRSAVSLATLAVVAVLLFAWWPSGNYRPIRPGERWTARETFSAVANLARGRSGSAIQSTPSPTPTATATPTTGATSVPSGTSSTATPTQTSTPSPTGSPSPSPSPSRSASPSPSPSASASP